MNTNSIRTNQVYDPTTDKWGSKEHNLKILVDNNKRVFDPTDKWKPKDR